MSEPFTFTEEEAMEMARVLASIEPHLQRLRALNKGKYDSRAE